MFGNIIPFVNVVDPYSIGRCFASQDPLDEGDQFTMS